MRPEDLASDEPLVGGDLPIDSVDILELVIMIEENYGVLIDSRELGEKVFKNLRTLAEYVSEHRKNKPG